MERWIPYFNYDKSKVGDWIPCKWCGRSFKKATYHGLFCSGVCAQTALRFYKRTREYPEGAPVSEVREAGGKLWLVTTQDAWWPTRVCRQCGRRLPLDRFKSSPYCSELCSSIAANTKAAKRAKGLAVKKTYAPRVCEWCGKEFIPKYKTKRCCSQFCSNKNALRKRAERGGDLAVLRGVKEEPNPCVVCGGEVPEGYVVHEACAAASSMKFNPVGVYKPGDKPKPFVYCNNCGSLLERGQRFCHICKHERYQKPGRRFKGGG